MAPNNNTLLQSKWQSIPEHLFRSNSVCVGFDAITYKRFMKLAKSSDNPGIMILPSYDYYDDAESPDIADPWFKDLVQDVCFMHKLCYQNINLLFTSLSS